MSSGGFIAIKRKNKKHRKYIYHMFDRDIRQLKQYGKLLKEEKEFDIPSALRLLDDLHTRGYFSSKYLSSTERDIAKQIIARALKTLRNNVQKIIETSEIIRDKHGFLEYFMDLSKVQFKSRYSELFGDKQELP